jgi:hypothetical protein
MGRPVDEVRRKKQKASELGNTERWINQGRVE